MVGKNKPVNTFNSYFNMSFLCFTGTPIIQNFLPASERQFLYGVHVPSFGPFCLFTCTTFTSPRPLRFSFQSYAWYFSCFILFRFYSQTILIRHYFQLKTVFAIGLIGLASIDVSFWAFRPEVKPVDMLDPGVRILTFGSILALVYAERRAGQRISAIQFVSFITWY